VLTSPPPGGFVPLTGSAEQVLLSGGRWERVSAPVEGSSTGGTSTSTPRRRVKRTSDVLDRVSIEEFFSAQALLPCGDARFLDDRPARNQRGGPACFDSSTSVPPSASGHHRGRPSPQSATRASPRLSGCLQCHDALQTPPGGTKSRNGHPRHSFTCTVTAAPSIAAQRTARPFSGRGAGSGRQATRSSAPNPARTSRIARGLFATSSRARSRAR